MDKRYFSRKIVEWYQQNKRELPWRSTKDPYYIWLSEVILQQTRVIQGLPYYQRFIEKFPTVTALASASERQILRLWQGLGYYTRARNLHKCAKTISKLHGGKFPNSYSELRLLPGVGDYTAAAVASIAFNEPVAVVDGNVFRVLSRIFGISTPINSTQGKREFNTLANSLVPKQAPDVFNQGMMEFGATFCTPKNPSCPTCVFKRGCVAFQQSLQLSLPVKLKKKESKKRYFYYLVFKRGESLLMKQRTEKDIWFGLYDFPVIERNSPVNISEELNASSWSEMIGAKSSISFSQPYTHILTHQTIVSQFIFIEQPKKRTNLGKNERFYSLKQIIDLPKPVLVSRFLNDAIFL